MDKCQRQRKTFDRIPDGLDFISPVSKKRVVQPLTLSQTIDGGLLRKAGEMKKDERNRRCGCILLPVKRSEKKIVQDVSQAQFAPSYTPSFAAKSQIVYLEQLRVGEVGDSYLLSSVFSMSQEGSGEETDDEQQFTVRNDMFSPFFNIAMHMKQINKNATEIGSQWPPISANLTLEAAFQSLPPAMFVYDNADFQEETLSGKGSTHVANEEFYLGKPGVLKVAEYCKSVQLKPGAVEVYTVNTTLKKCIAMTDKLTLQCAVVVFDEAVYCKAQMIRWKNQEFLDRVVVRLGDFHMDILVESEIVAAGSVKGIMSGKQLVKAGEEADDLVRLADASWWGRFCKEMSETVNAKGF
eukprot:gene9955-18567_t